MPQDNIQQPAVAVDTTVPPVTTVPVDTTTVTPVATVLPDATATVTATPNDMAAPTMVTETSAPVMTAENATEVPAQVGPEVVEEPAVTTVPPAVQ